MLSTFMDALSFVNELRVAVDPNFVSIPQNHLFELRI